MSQMLPAADWVLSRLHRASPESKGWDSFPLYPDDPLAPQQKRLDLYLRQAAPTMLNFWRIKPTDYPAGRDLFELALEETAQIVRAIVVRFLVWKHFEGDHIEKFEQLHREHGLDALLTAVRERIHRILPGSAVAGLPKEEFNCPFALRPLLAILLRANPPLTPEDLAAMIELASRQPGDALTDLMPRESVLHAVERTAARLPLPALVRQKLAAWRKEIQGRQRIGSENRKLLARISALIGSDSLAALEPGEAWSDAALENLQQMSAEESVAWTGLLKHCRKAEASKPTAKWLKEAGDLVEKIGRLQFRSRVIHWFDLVALPRPAHKEVHPHAHLPDPALLICEQNATILRGLAWCCAGWKDTQVNTALANLAEVCFKKIRWVGPRCPRVGNACLYSLSATSSEDAAAQLSRLDSTVKQPTAKKRIGKSLDAAALLTGQTREDLEEKSVPTFALGLDGRLSQIFGGYSAELRVIHSRDVEIRWSRSDGKPLKAVPAEVKRDHADEFKHFQKLGKDIGKMLIAQRIRIERLLMAQREWDLESWRQRYLDHPLLAGISRRLIWHFKLGERTALGAWIENKIVDVCGETLDWLAPETRVRLWHPIGFPVETVAAWREWIQTHEVCQPFKQAHREIYILTDAELRAATYSNRFAAHILGQHQFAALCGQRGWKYSFMGGFDFQATPTLELPAWNMSVEFWVEPAGQLADSGVALHLTTDQVRFVRAGEPLPLTEVPATVFSEVMRDIDLFVGVGSIGNDPAWQDRGEIPGGGEYWQSYSFGELNASAKTRKEILARLLPKLRIASECSFDDKFLIVRGSLRTYKIHLGSGNIQMEPNNQYLCIVPDHSSVAKDIDKLFLPFDGDRTLSIILSKAFLLAADSKIKDPGIQNQIKR